MRQCCLVASNKRFKMKWIAINTNNVMVNGSVQKVRSAGKDMLTEIYRKHIGDYPKFFKMDGLSKLGFVASELLLNSEGCERFVSRDDRAVILFNSTGSYEADNKYQATISDSGNYYPSPSMFVYTLPNIVTGEIAIRNKYFGETSFYVIEHFSEEEIANVCVSTFTNKSTQSILCGWVNYANNEHFCCLMFIIERKDVEELMPFLQSNCGTLVAFAV